MKKHCLALEGIQFHANHGYYQEETKKGGEYIVDIYLYLNLEEAGKKDDLTHTVNYESIYEIVKDVMSTPKKLIESVAYEIQNKIIVQHKEINSFTIRVRKLDPPLDGKVNQSFVEFRHQNDDLDWEKTNSNPNSQYWEERGKY